MQKSGSILLYQFFLLGYLALLVNEAISGDARLILLGIIGLGMLAAARKLPRP